MVTINNIKYLVILLIKLNFVIHKKRIKIRIMKVT